MNFIISVITFNPTEFTLESVKSYIDYVEKLIIWDNTPIKSNSIIKELEREYSSKVKIMGEYENRGISYALNRIFEYAIAEGYSYVLTMDQDSLWENFESYLNSCNLCLNDSIAIYAPIVKIGDKVIRCNKTDFVITSGSLYSIDVFKKIGMFREEYFIDEVDNEYCIRARMRGFEIRIIDDAFMVQIFGTPSNKSWIDRYTVHYSPFRTYHQIRNRTWVWRQYHKHLSFRYFLRTLLFQTLRRMVLVMIAEENKSDKLKAICKGWYHGLCKPITPIIQYE
jgi:rhamnosyltransferase